jgi:hypothetical protein
LETAEGRMKLGKMKLWEQTVRLSGAERQRWRHRRERACVRPPSLVGRMEMMAPRISSGR